jgi:cell division protein ZapA (FtsZ GTPase activity inhibitor)
MDGTADSIKLKITIAGRFYPLIIKREEEQHVRNVANRLDGMIKKMKDEYSISDIQDVLSMCALQLMLKKENFEQKESEEIHFVATRIDMLSDKIKNVLNKNK